MRQTGSLQLQCHQVSHRRKFGGGDSLKWHEELVELGIFICLHHEELGMGHLALDRRDKLDAHFRGPGGPISDRRAATGAWAALRRMCQRCMEPHSSFSFWFDDAIVTRSRKMLPSITGRVLEGAMLHEWNTAVESILGGRIAISQLNRETDTQ